MERPRVCSRGPCLYLSLFLGLFLAVGLCVFAGVSISRDRPAPAPARIEPSLPAPEIQARLKRYVPADIGVPSWEIDARTRGLLDKLVEAAQGMDRAFWDQVSDNGLALSEALGAQEDPASRAAASLMRINFGPWDRIADHEPFVGSRPKPEGANLYPADLSRRELEKWMADHPGDKDAFQSPYTVIRREGAALKAAPYSRVFAEPLAAAAKALREAAALSDCWPLTQFLRARAESFATDDYYKSELLWVDTGSCPVDIVIGPYETYEDRLMGWKAAFEAFVTVRDDIETTRAAILTKYSGELLANLPLGSAALGGRFEEIRASPIVVANEVFAAGDARAGFQVRAFVLPNDERVRKAQGTKHVILLNVVRARFVHLLRPLSEVVLAQQDVDLVDFDAYFKLMLMWELAHGLAPKSVALAGGEDVEPRMLLRQRFGPIEAARAEAVSLLNARYFADKAVFAARAGRTLPVTYLASLFESLRFGTSGTQGQAKLIVLNFLAERGAIKYDPDARRFRVVFERWGDAVRDLAEELLTIELTGDYNRAGKLIGEYGAMPADVRARLAEAGNLPVDIRPRYTFLFEGR